MKNRLNKLSLKGFTLIELLVVIAVLGVLAAVIVAAINPLAKINQAKDSTVKSDMGQLVNALAAYYTNQAAPAYPLTLGGLVPGELKTLPTQQASNVACPAAAANVTLNTSGVAGSAGYYYCYYRNTATSEVAAVMGSLYVPTSSTWYCWDSTTGAFKNSTATPAYVAGPPITLSCP